MRIKRGQKAGRRKKTMIEGDTACKEARKALKSEKRSEKKPWGQERRRTSKIQEKKVQKLLGDH